MNALEPVVLDETILDETASCKFDDNSAAWLAGCLACPRRSLWCNEHYERRMRQIEDDGPLHPYRCKDCGASAWEFHDVFFVVKV